MSDFTAKRKKIVEKSKVYHYNYKYRDIPWWIVLLMCMKNKNTGQHLGQHLFHLS